PGERERILDRQPNLVEGVAAARHPPEVICRREAAPPDTVQLDAALAERAGPLVRDHRRRSDASGAGHLEVDANVVALDHVSREAVAPHLGRPRREAHPRGREDDDEHEADRHRVERTRPERPRGEIDDDAEHGDGAAAPRRHTGTGVFASASRTISALPTPAARASGPRINRCPSTGAATAFTSSGTRNSRPSASASAFATRRRAIPARG